MRFQIVGIELQDYTMDNGYSFKGKKLHCIDCDTEKPSLNGQMVTTLKISDDNPMANTVLTVGKDYTVYFDQKGKLVFIKPAN